MIDPEENGFFTKMVDELVEYSKQDPQLADGIRWIDETARKRGVSFYEMVFQVLHKYDITLKAKNWIDTRS